MGNPLLSVCMIVRDEEANLPRALESVKGVADELIIVDTGSRDRTVEVARSFGGRVLTFPWTGDFSAARNVGLEAAHGRWIMVLDADEELNAEDRHKVKPLLVSGQAEAYICPVTNLVDSAGHLDYEHSFLLRFWRNRPQYRYSGLVHEDLTPSIFKHKPDAQLSQAPIRFTHYGYLTGTAEARRKRERNLALLRKQVEQDPDNHFYRFNLGVEYQIHRRFEEALAEYRMVRPSAEGKPWEPKLVKGIIYSLLSLERWDEALTECQAGLAKFPDFTDLLFFRGVAEFGRGESARAAATFSQCAAMGPAPVPPYASAEEGLGSWKALYALGQAYQAAGRLHEAVGAYEQATALRPEWTEPLQATAGVLLGAGVEPAMVRDYIEQHLSRAIPNRALVIADILYRGGAHAAALEAIPPDLEGDAAAWAEYLRGYCRIRLGDWSGAERDLVMVPKGDPRRQAAVAGLAYCRWCQGQEEAMNEALAELGDDEEAKAQAARLFIEGARAALAEGLERFPDSAPLRDLLERLGRETV